MRCPLPRWSALLVLLLCCLSWPALAQTAADPPGPGPGANAQSLAGFIGSMALAVATITVITEAIKKVTDLSGSWVLLILAGVSLGVTGVAWGFGYTWMIGEDSRGTAELIATTLVNAVTASGLWSTLKSVIGKPPATPSGYAMGKGVGGLALLLALLPLTGCVTDATYAYATEVKAYASNGGGIATRAYLVNGDIPLEYRSTIGRNFNGLLDATNTVLGLPADHGAVEVPEPETPPAPAVEFIEPSSFQPVALPPLPVALRE